MTPKPPRLTQPRRWTGLAFASVTLAAAPALADLHRVAPITLATPDAQLWLAQSQGGEGGEAGVTADATPEATVLVKLMIVEGHMRAARDLYALNQRDMAVDLSRHPQEEGKLDTLRKLVGDQKGGDISSVIALFTDTMTKGAPLVEVDGALASVGQVFTAVAAGEPSNIGAQFDAVTLLLKAASEEYQGSIKDGAVEDVMAWYEARSFLALAREGLGDLAALPKSSAAANKALSATLAADEAFGDPNAQTPLAGDGQILLGVAARVELIAASVR